MIVHPTVYKKYYFNIAEIGDKIIKLLNEKDGLTAKEIIKKVRGNKSIIHQLLDMYVERGLLIEKLEANEKIYLLNDKHYRYIRCVRCRKKEMIEEDIFDHKYNDYKVLNYTLIIDGICSECQKYEK